ncbi:MAG: type VI secretion system-associated protein TagF [Betaproteobacteria bacterium]
MTPGFFGKLPSAGDFVGRGWSPGLRDGLDLLVRGALGALATEGKSLADVMPKAPGLALAVRPGVLAATGFTGVMVPSSDRVGREFELCVGFETTGAGADLGWLPASAVAVLHGLALRALHQVFSADDLADALEDIDCADRLAAGREAQLFGGDDTLPRLDASAALLWMPAPGGSLAPSIRALCAMLQTSVALLGERLDRAGRGDGYFAARRALAAREVAAWFDGEWTARGWTTLAGPAAVHDDDPTRPLPRLPEVSG